MITNSELLQSGTLRRKLFNIFVWLAAIVLIQIVIAFVLPRMIFQRDAKIVDTLLPITQSSRDVRLDVLSMVGGAAQWGLSGKSEDLALFIDGQTNLPKDITTLAQLGRQEPQLNTQITALIQEAEDESASIEATVSSGQDATKHVRRTIAGNFAKERNKLAQYLSAQHALTDRIDGERKARAHAAAHPRWPRRSRQGGRPHGDRRPLGGAPLSRGPGGQSCAGKL